MKKLKRCKSFGCLFDRISGLFTKTVDFISDAFDYKAHEKRAKRRKALRIIGTILASLAIIGFIPYKVKVKKDKSYEIKALSWSLSSYLSSEYADIAKKPGAQRVYSITFFPHIGKAKAADCNL